MQLSIKNLVADLKIVALTFKQELNSVDGPDVPIFPPTYPVPEKGLHRFDTPYTVNETKDGIRICDLDSVQSQANRMEAAFTGELADVVPRHVVQAGGHQVDLTEIPHRIVDASIRATELTDDIRQWMLEVASGKPCSLAKHAPTSLVYGAWDSRDTNVKIPRVIRSEIRAYDVSIFTRSAQYSGTFRQEELCIDDDKWNRKKGGAASVGLAPTPSIDRPGGILVHGKIVHSASILLNAIRKYQVSNGCNVLPNYLLGLTLGGLLVGGRDYSLRSGCLLIPAAAAEWQTVSRTGERRSIDRKDTDILKTDILKTDILKEVREVAQEWSKKVSVTLGGEPKIHKYSEEEGNKMFPSRSA